MAFIYRQSEEDEEWDSVSWNLRNCPPPHTVNGAVDRPFWGSSGRVYPQFRKKGPDLFSRFSFLPSLPAAFLILRASKPALFGANSLCQLFW